MLKRLSASIFTMSFGFSVLCIAQDNAAAEVVVLDRTLDAPQRGAEDDPRLLEYRTNIWYESTFWSGPDWTRVGRNWHHPGQNTPSVRRFTAPRDGKVKITGRVAKLHLKGDGTRAIIRHNDRELWQAEIAGDDAEGVGHNLTLDVAKGDSIRFVVHKLGAITADTTAWDPAISYPDETFQASTAFGKHRQGFGGWWYEMEGDVPPPADAPTVHTLTQDLSLIEYPVAGDRSTELSSQQALPLVVVFNRRANQGLLVAVDTQRQWSLETSVDSNGRLRVVWKVDAPQGPSPLVWSETFSGSPVTGFAIADEAMAAGRLDWLDRHVDRQFGPDRLPLALWAIIQDDWRRQDANDDTVDSFSTAALSQLAKARAVLDVLQSAAGVDSLDEHRRQLDRLREEASRQYTEPAEARSLWLQVRLLKRRIVMANPLIEFGPMLIAKRVPPSWSHMVAQYYGWRQRPGGGLYVLENPGYSLAVRDVVAGQLPPGSFLEPRLSYDARRILFSYVACGSDPVGPDGLPVNEQGGGDRYFDVYEINVDGSGLRRLTSGPYDDLMATYLPDGGIVFCSTRRRSYSRCFGPEYSLRWDAYTLHRMDADGGNIEILSLNDVNEWFPAVSNTGHLLFARWDYIDRDAVTHQNLWAVRPDGTNPVAVWGNATPKPHCTFQAKPIPDSSKIVFTASAHHSITGGPICLLDPTVDANSLDAISRVTPLPFPEAEGTIDEWYESPWPLSEDYFLAAYSADQLRFQGVHVRDPNPDNSLGIYLIDTAGNSELLYRDPAISSMNPTPLVPRRRPPVIGSTLADNAEPAGEMIVTDVYEGLGDVHRGTIKQLRVVQVFPKTTPLVNQPRIGLAGEENGRAILGTVPVEADGSARFLVPAHKPVLFQLLDADGLAYQTMRSSTYVQPGERTSCTGCHEHRMSTPSAAARMPMALERPPSTIEPGELGGRPFSFVEVVQPVLDRHCVSCHDGEKTPIGIDLTGTPHDGFTKSYWSLCRPTADEWRRRKDHPELSALDLVPRFWQRNQIQATPPGGQYGARGSRLMKLLLEGHEDVELAAAEIRRLAAWIDLNAIFYGVYDPEAQARQLAGHRVPMPEIE